MLFALYYGISFFVLVYLMVNSVIRKFDLNET